MIELAGMQVGEGQPLLLIAGPDVIESEEHALRHAVLLRELAARHGLRYVFKCSFDKANRTSGTAFRGPGLVEGLRVLARVKEQARVPVLTDVHEVAQVGPVAEVVDVLQVPAFLCRQTDLVVAVARTGRGVNLKKGQFVAPLDMVQAARKAFEAGNRNVLVTERGASFGYHNLVVDMRSFALLHDDGIPVIYDVTHSLQLPGGGSGARESGGNRRFAEPLARAAVAAGADGVFLEVHPDPEHALSDSAVQLPLERAEELIKSLLAIRKAL